MAGQPGKEHTVTAISVVLLLTAYTGLIYGYLLITGKNVTIKQLVFPAGLPGSA
jgi:hypothetical protein